MAFGTGGQKAVVQGEVNQTKTQLSKLEQELTKKLDELGIADPTIINLIKTHPWLFYLLFLKTEDLKIGETKKFTQGNITLTITRTKNEQFKLSLVTKEDDGKKSIKTVEIKKPIDKLGELRKFIERRFSFKLDGGRVWVYPVTTGKETETEEKEKGWRFRIPPGFRKAHPDLARFFDLSNKFNIDARSWIENPEEAAKQFNLAKRGQVRF